jgi:hypothetical protein
MNTGIRIETAKAKQVSPKVHTKLTPMASLNFMAEMGTNSVNKIE